MAKAIEVKSQSSILVALGAASNLFCRRSPRARASGVLIICASTLRGSLTSACLQCSSSVKQSNMFVFTSTLSKPGRCFFKRFFVSNLTSSCCCVFSAIGQLRPPPKLPWGGLCSGGSLSVEVRLANSSWVVGSFQPWAVMNWATLTVSSSANLPVRVNWELGAMSMVLFRSSVLVFTIRVNSVSKVRWLSISPN